VSDESPAEATGAYGEIASRGRTMLANLDCRVSHDAPFLLACECEGRALDLAIRRVSLFALSLSGIIGTIVALRAAPLPIGSIAVFWLVASLAARLFARRRAREHGRFVIDFEHDRVTHETMSGAIAVVALAKSTSVEVIEGVDALAPYWLVLRPVPGIRWRIARGTHDELRPLLRIFRGYHFDVRGEPAERED
jgi:hypothetical protein